ncbi:MAG TPA: hypothetical protein PLU35_05830 [Phycisphaerales bacterium]|nr:hypothetical protein [Phycisphaerales bacterium]
MDATSLLTLAASTPTRPPVGPLPGLLIAAGLMIILFIVMRKVQQRIAARAQQDMSPRERIDALRTQAAERDSAEAVMAEMHDLARELAAQLEARAAKLEKLIRDADERLSRLDALEAPRARSGRQVSPTPTADPLHTRVYELADRGLPTVEIAREIDRPTGQVELILALRRTG